MSVMLDVIGAALLVGMLMLTILSVNMNMTLETYKSASDFHTQTEMIQLARILEFDLYKMGYWVTKPCIITADTSHLKFRANLQDVAGARDSVEYLLGTPVTSSVNPRDKHLLRVENITHVSISYSVTRFQLTYYNTRDSVMTTPVTGAYLDSIRAIKVYMSLESPQPFDSSYSGAFYEKIIYPRNLQQ
jgi:hypothetical protein